MPVLDVVVAALSIVLVVSGILKVRDPEATVPMLRAVGLPTATAVVVAVAIVEIATGAATLVIGGRLPTLVLAGLFATFAVVSGMLLRGDGSVPCGCFGQRSAAVSGVHVAVNATAAVVATVSAVLGGSTIVDVGGDRSVGVVLVGLLAAALLAGVIVALLTGAFDRFGAPTAGSSAPLAVARHDDGRLGDPADLAPISGRDPHDVPVEVPIAGSGGVTLLAFLTTGCTTCARFWHEFAGPGGATLPGSTALVIVTRGDDREDPNRVRDLAPAAHPVVRSSEAWLAYGVTAGPYFVLADGDRNRILGEGAATEWADVVVLVAQAVGARSHDDPTPSAPSSGGVAE